MKPLNEAGFILLEVMLAFVVLVFGTVVVFQSFRTSLQVVRQTRELYAGSLLMEGQMAELERTGVWSPSPLTDSQLGTLNWRKEVRDAGSPYWKEHDLILAWGEGKYENQLQLPTYLTE